MSTLYAILSKKGPLVSYETAAKLMEVSVRTVERRIKEMQAEIRNGRYSMYVFDDDDSIKLVHFPSLYDFTKFRKALADPNARKHVPEFRPKEIEELMGIDVKVVHKE